MRRALLRLLHVKMIHYLMKKWAKTVLRMSGEVNDWIISLLVLIGACYYVIYSLICLVNSISSSLSGKIKIFLFEAIVEWVLLNFKVPNFQDVLLEVV